MLSLVSARPSMPEAAQPGVQAQRRTTRTDAGVRCWCRIRGRARRSTGRPRRRVRRGRAAPDARRVGFSRCQARSRSPWARGRNRSLHSPRQCWRTSRTDRCRDRHPARRLCAPSNKCVCPRAASLVEIFESRRHERQYLRRDCEQLVANRGRRSAAASLSRGTGDHGGKPTIELSSNVIGFGEIH